MKIAEKPAAYVQNHLLKSLKALDKMNRHIDKTKRLNKSEVRILIEELKEPLMRAFGYVFPDEEV